VGGGHTFNKVALILFHKGRATALKTEICPAGAAPQSVGSAVLTRCMCPLKEVRRLSIGKFCGAFWGRVPAALGLRLTWLQGTETSVSKLSSESTDSSRWLYDYARGQRREMVPASSFVLAEVAQGILRFVTNFPSSMSLAPFKLPFKLYFCRLFVVLSL